MPRNQKAGTARIDLDITVEAKTRFQTIQKTLGFKTQTETFEALVYSITAKEIIDPGVIGRMERMLGQVVEKLDSLT